MVKLAGHGQLLVTLQKGWLFGRDELAEHMDDTMFICTIPLCDAFFLIMPMEGDGEFCEIRALGPNTILSKGEITKEMSSFCGEGYEGN